MVIKEIIEELDKYLDRNEIFTILEFVLNMDKTKVLINLGLELTKIDEEKIRNILKRRVNKEPLQYILHEQFFYRNKFYVNENVLIPRADTEILIDEVLQNVNNNCEVLDLCTGSGCIAISLKKNNSSLKITASDISKNALTVAMLNSLINDAEVNFINSDLFENINKKFDVIVSNPPYIESCEIENLQDEVKKEPCLALDGGEDGLKFYEKIIFEAPNYLTENGLIAFEIGYNQADVVGDLLKKNNFRNIRIIKDYGNNDRVVVAKK